MSKFIDRITYLPKLILNNVSMNKDFYWGKTIVVAGAPRSGTTFLMNLLDVLPDYLTVFEPLNVNWFPHAKRLPNYTRPYLPVDEESTVYHNFFSDVFKGNIHCVHPHYEWSMKKNVSRIKANKLLIKFIRVNRLLLWLSKNFELKRIFLIIRHPCATISSQITTGIRGYFSNKQKFPFKQALEDILMIDTLDDEIKTSLLRIRHYEEFLAAAWALDYYVPICHSKKDYHIIKYEDLLIHDRKTIKNIFDSLRRNKYFYDALDIINEPTETTLKEDRKKIVNRNIKYQLSKWKRQLSKKQIKKIRSVLELFEITFDNEINYEF